MSKTRWDCVLIILIKLLERLERAENQNWQASDHSFLASIFYLAEIKSEILLYEIIGSCGRI